MAGTGGCSSAWRGSGARVAGTEGSFAARRGRRLKQQVFEVVKVLAGLERRVPEISLLLVWVTELQRRVLEVTSMLRGVVEMEQWVPDVARLFGGGIGAGLEL